MQMFGPRGRTEILCGLFHSRFVYINGIYSESLLPLLRRG